MEKYILKTFTVVLLFLACFKSISAFTVEVLPGEKMCFHEQMKKGERLLVGFQVQDGPEYEIDFYVENAQGKQIDQYLKSMGYEKSYEAEIDGRITYCFHNTNTAYPAKWVSFYMFKDDVDTVSKEKQMKDPLEKELMHLKEGLRSFKEEQQYLIMRERVHRNTAESTNSRVMWWSIFQTIMLVSVCLWQVWYIKRFFEVKRSV